MKISDIKQYRDKLKIENIAYIIQILTQAVKLKLLQYHDILFSTRKRYAETGLGLVPLDIDTSTLDFHGIDIRKADELYRMYRNHQFDLLGSGWTKVSYEDNAKGFQQYKYEVPVIHTDKNGLFLHELINKSNLYTSKRIWGMLSDDYTPIDWQKDFISGYRWDNSKWYRPQVVADKPGGDIKVPWELGRMQHLPRLALMYRMFPERDREILGEFCNQLIDFSATNPPRYGVNYVCTMDIGIRTANVALAYSMFKSQNVTFSKEFEEFICGFIFEHCEHIRNNLEWSKFLTSNHYFADIAGLLYGSAILPKCKKREKWLRFAANEINKEIVKQFYREGSNGEGSTAYHRLTGEMAVYSLAVIKYLNKHGEKLRLDQEALEIIEKSGEFSNAITRPDGMFTQIGDNDSGLFFRLSITGELLTVEQAVAKYANLQNYKIQQLSDAYLDENMNDARPFISSVAGMFENEKFQEAERIYPLESSLVNQLVGTQINVGNQIGAAANKPDKNDEKLQYVSSYIISANDRNLLEETKWVLYHEFGIYIFRGKNIYLCVNAADNGQKGNGGHAHNDKLSFELFIGDECIFEDSGTYVYTSCPELRNKFRSVNIHNTIFTGIEQNEYNGLFAMYSRSKCRVIDVRSNSIKVEVCYGDIIHRREFIIKNDCIIIQDECNKVYQAHFMQNEVTRGYGKILVG